MFADENVIKIKPISINGYKYASGIIRRRKSVMEIKAEHVSAPANNKMNNMLKIMFFPLAFRIGCVLYLYYNV